MAHDAVIISSDGVFAHMLSIELKSDGICTIFADEISNTYRGILIFDCDSKKLPADFFPKERTVTFSYSQSGEGIKHFMRPFDVAEFVDFIKSLLKEMCTSEDSVNDTSNVSPLVFTDEKRVVFWGHEAELTPREYTLLKFLFENRGRTVTREECAFAVWGREDRDTNVVDVYIRYLREKLDIPAEKKLIHTVRGGGYTIKLERS